MTPDLTSDVQSSLGAKLEARRKQLGVKRNQLAMSLGLTLTRVRRTLGLARGPVYLRDAMMIASALGLDLSFSAYTKESVHGVEP